MLITDKKDRGYAYVSMDDIVSSIEVSNELEINELKNLFSNCNYENDKIRISKDSSAYKILSNSKNIINGDEYITPSMLSEAYTRASIEFNYDMKDRLFKYIKKYVDNVSENKSNEKLIQRILCDDKTMEYVYRFNSFEDYVKHMIGTRIKQRDNEKNNEVKNRSFVKIAA